MKYARPRVSLDRVQNRIIMVRRQRVLLDAHLARLYGVSTKALNQAVKRNLRRFPADFMFQLTSEEKEEVVTDCDHLDTLKFSPVLPYAFTEHGAIMAASVLNSPRAVEMSLYVVRAFVRLRQIMAAHADLSRRLDELEKRYDKHSRQVVEAIRELMERVEPPRRQIGFQAKEGGVRYRTRSRR